jgi:hypothetical protein
MISVILVCSGLLKEIPQGCAVMLALLTPGFYNESDREREQECRGDTLGRPALRR